MSNDNISQEQVVRTLQDAKFVMLTTALSDGKLLAHPMVPQQVTDNADVWFFLGLDTDQVQALRGNPNVNIAVAEAGSWLSVAGRVEFVHDPAKVDELWNDQAAAWFENGRDNDNVGLIYVVSDSAQYWGTPGGKVSALTKIAKAKVSGSKVQGTSDTVEF